jgi:hypothetical protein
LHLAISESSNVTMTDEYKDAEPRDEDPFDLIHKGNAFSSSSSHWAAADAYSRASLALLHRADAICDSAKRAPSPNKKKEEEEKIISLYRTQSLEYFYKARHCLMEALTFENEQDRRNITEVASSGKGQLDPTCSFIGNEEEKRRRSIFERLFVMPCPESCRGIKLDAAKSNSSPIKQENSSTCNKMYIEIPEAPSSLLPSINASTRSSSSLDIHNNDSIHRLDDIRSGLQRLGVSLPDETNKAKPFIQKEISNEDQVKLLIIQQATDEVHIERISSNKDFVDSESV